MHRIHILYVTVFCVSLIQSAGAHAACISNVTSDAKGFAPSWVKEPDGRGTWTIVYSTSLSLFLCAWTSLHLNIPRTDETWSEMIWRFVKWGLLSFLVPEFVIFIALLQWYRARKFRSRLNAILADEEEKWRKLGKSLEGRDFTPFTSLYAWFALMGGFGIDTSKLHNTLNVGILDLDGLLYLAQCGQFFRLSDAQISDKSKADYLAKGLVCLQVSWFVGQGISRKVAGLPISLLEFHALVNIGCALLTYLLWFTKPLAVKTPSVADPAPFEQLVAVLLFNAELDDKPKFYLTVFQAPKSKPPRESWLWCWVPNKPMLSINPHIPEHIFERIPEANVRIRPITTETVAEQDMLHGRDIVPLLDEPRCYLGCGCTWNDRDGKHRVSTKRHTFYVDLSTKDVRRIVLVRQYIEAKYGVLATATVAEQNASQELSRPQPTASPSRTFRPTSIRPASSSPPTYAVSSDLEAQNVDNDCDRGRSSSSSAPVNITREDVASMDRRQRMPLQRIPCINNVPRDCIHSILPNFDSTDVLDYGVTRLSRWRWWLTVTALLIVPSSYGAVHIYPDVTDFSFPTESEKRIWRVSCIFIMTIVGGPLAFSTIRSLLSAISEATKFDQKERRGRKREKTKQRVLRRILLGFAAMYFIAWVTARAYLMVESFISLRREQAEIFQTPEWNWLNYIPHI